MMDLLHRLPPHAAADFVEMPELEIAASDLQQRVRNGQSNSLLVPAEWTLYSAVRVYIAMIARTLLRET